MNVIQENQDEIFSICKRFKVRSLHIFGSYANGTENEASDLDFIVEFDRSGYEGAFEQFMGMKEELESLLKRPVDLITNSRFRNRLFEDEVERSKRLVYAA